MKEILSSFGTIIGMIFGFVAILIWDRTEFNKNATFQRMILLSVLSLVFLLCLWILYSIEG